MSRSLAALFERLEGRSGTPRSRNGRKSSLCAALLTLVGCAGSGPTQTGCTGVSAEAIVNGSDTESYLGLAAPQARAVVRIQDQNQPNGPLCSGVFVTSEWIATAAHCLQISAAQVLVGSFDDTVQAFPILTEISNPARDVALLKVDLSSTAPLPDIEPIAIAAPDNPALVEGELVELAGFGLTELGTARKLRFLVEPISAVDDATITVDGSGVTGACDGDSGGPLLARATSGEVTLVGLLSLGSVSCQDDDEYVRVDALQTWIVQTVGRAQPGSNDCGNIDVGGRCLYGMPMWCDEGVLFTTTCSASTACGWDATQSGFRCVAPSADSCHGIDSNGSCFEGSPARCIGGVLDRTPCACGVRCGLDGTTGGASCAH